MSTTSPAARQLLEFLQPDVAVRAGYELQTLAAQEWPTVRDSGDVRRLLRFEQHFEGTYHADEPGREAWKSIGIEEGPQHEVAVRRPFAAGRLR